MPIPNENSSLLNIQRGSKSTSLNDHSGSSVNIPVITREDPGLPIPRAVFVVTNAALGAGMLNFPEAYGKTGGVVQALAVQAVSLANL